MVMAPTKARGIISGTGNWGEEEIDVQFVSTDALGFSFIYSKLSMSLIL
jgi:hypothetical protein